MEFECHIIPVCCCNSGRLVAIGSQSSNPALSRGKYCLSDPIAPYVIAQNNRPAFAPNVPAALR